MMTFKFIQHLFIETNHPLVLFDTTDIAFLQPPQKGIVLKNSCFFLIVQQDTGKISINEQILIVPEDDNGTIGKRGFKLGSFVFRNC